MRIPLPYDIHHNGRKWCVRRRGSTRNLGCHDTRAKAIKQQRALYVNAPLSAEEVTVMPTMEGVHLQPGETGTLTVLENGESFAEIDDRGPAFRGPIAIEGWPTSDKRVLMSGEIDERDFPLPLNVQIQTADGHQNSFNAGRIDSIEHISVSDLSPDVIEEFKLAHLPETASVIWGGLFRYLRIRRRGAADDLERLRGVDRHEP